MTNASSDKGGADAPAPVTRTVTGITRHSADCKDRDHGVDWPACRLSAVPWNWQAARTSPGRIRESQPCRRANRHARGAGLSAATPADLRPPLLLYVRGDVKILSPHGIAVVGTRPLAPYGSGMAERLSIDLVARTGWPSSAGMARGVDTAAHPGAIAAKGKTVAGVWYRSGRSVTEGEQPSRGTSPGLGRSAHLRIRAGYVCGTPELPDSQADHQRHVDRRSSGGSSRIQRHAHHSTLCPGAESRHLCRVRQRDQQEFVGPSILMKQGAKLTATWEDI